MTEFAELGLSEFMYCMKTNLPKTKFLTFNWKRSESLIAAKGGVGCIDWDSYLPQYVTKPPQSDYTASYESGCSGDSGSGQFVRIPNENTYVLVAIFRQLYGKKFTVHRNGNKKKHRYPCGSFTWREGRYRYKSALSESTTWRKNLNWIEKKIDLISLETV